MEPGDWVICIKHIDGVLVIDKKYLILALSATGKHISIIINHGKAQWFKTEFFISERQIRNNKLDNILND